MGLRIRTTTLLALLVTVACPAVATASSGVERTSTLRPRLGRVMGIEAPAGRAFDTATGIPIPVVYHGGPVMDTGTVTVHTIFWAPAGYAFDGAPTSGTLGYTAMIQQFFTDVAHDSGSHTNVFSVLDQYGDRSGAGQYSIAYNAQTDSVAATDPYPTSANQCPSPAGVSTCVTDAEVAQEVDKVIERTDPTGYGLHDVWEVFLPPNVDECSSLGVCGTSSFAGYHSLADVGHGTFIYAIMIDTLIETPSISGADPEGNPEAESTIDTSAHETVEAITNPEGDGWMDPNGFEVADKCESGPQTGTPLGYAADGSPYDQVINGHEYDIQEMWSNSGRGCMQRTTATASVLPLPEISLRQFSSRVSGNIGAAKANVPVRVVLIRAGAFVAEGAGLTNRTGSWGPLTLRGPHGAAHGVGDDRDELIVAYGNGGPGPDLIATGAGGNPFNEAGWTDWFDLDTGFELGDSAIAVAPCGQTGLLTVTVGHVSSTAPVPHCQTELDASVTKLPPVTGRDQVLLTSEDNRAVSEASPNGALVRLTVALGEPGSVASVTNSSIPFSASGMPRCIADLRAGSASCSGLVPGGSYTLVRSRGGVAVHARAGFGGVLKFARLPGRLPITGGDVLTLRNAAGRVLTALHVAHLRVAITGNENVIASGTCQPGEYWGSLVTSQPTSAAVGQPGSAGLGTICPASGSAHGLSAASIAQTDDRSGGLTETSVPQLGTVAPVNGAIVYGAFRALARTDVPASNGSTVGVPARVTFAVSHLGSDTPIWWSGNVDLRNGVAVPRFPAGVYDATWVVHDLNGDTRVVVTEFVEQ